TGRTNDETNGAQGFLVEEMAPPPVGELLVGLRRDPVYGISLTVGSGGVTAELLGDVATLVLPVGRDEIRAAIDGLRLAPLLNGYRGRAAADLEAAVDAIAAMAAIPEPAYRQVLQTLVTFNRRGDQHRLTCPCCLIAVGEDDNSPARVMAKMAGGLAHATFHIVETAGHLVNSEAGVECNAIIDRFLDGVQAQTESF
ncbi:MAG: acetate--CoA ligase family protein, partial [Pseudomonadota bacterium]|nr:acetate--CoA ligase family protein [Pseudomonadota bacterium]